MQGRLLPVFKSNYQAHPVGHWESEFKIARDLGLSNIEFILDAYLYNENPLLSDRGIQKIKENIKSSQVGVKSICTDIFMTWPLNNLKESEENYFHNLICKLIINASEIGVLDIVFPFVDNSSLKNENEMDFVVSFLDRFEELCVARNINLSLETDLKPSEFLRFLKKFKNTKIRVNYDSGNSASNGYKLEEELKLYGNLISNIHIKDRIFNGGPVPLGAGVAELKGIKEFIFKGFEGIVSFQAFRNEEPIKTFKKQFEFFKNL